MAIGMLIKRLARVCSRPRHLELYGRRWVFVREDRTGAVHYRAVSGCGKDFLHFYP